MVEEPDFFCVVETLFMRGTKEEIALFVRIARKLWFRQNDLVFKGNFTHPTELLRAAKQAHKDFLAINKKDTHGDRGDETLIEARWVAPTQTWHKTN
jgi:hypothetical protein